MSEPPDDTPPDATAPTYRTLPSGRRIRTLTAAEYERETGRGIVAFPLGNAAARDWPPPPEAAPSVESTPTQAPES